MNIEYFLSYNHNVTISSKMDFLMRNRVLLSVSSGDSYTAFDPTTYSIISLLVELEQENFRVN